jgi:hypothetical protein
MQNVLTIFVTITLFVIACQDWRSRSVYWWLFPLLAVGGCMMSLTRLGAPGVFFRYLSINLGILIVQLAALQAYFFIRRRNARSMIGVGDVFFLVAVCCFFSPMNFMVFYVGSLGFSIGAAVVIRGTGRTRWETVPLAGLQAIFFIGCLFTSMISNYSLVNDHWLIKKLGG